MIKILFLSLALLLSLPAQAHKASDAYLRLETAQTENAKPSLDASVALRDLDRAIESLDANNDRQLTQGEVKAAMPQILQLVQQNIALRCASQEQALEFAFEALEQRSDGVFTRLQARWPAGCNLASAELRYSLMQGIDADHRAILSIDSRVKNAPVNTPSGQASARVLSPSSEWAALQTPTPSVLQTLASFITLGISHIGSGADHIAFVICLVLGLSLLRDWKTLLATLTAFTLGHSITLIAATLGWVGSPVWVEPVIAASIAVTAALNLITLRAAWAKSLLLKAAITTAFGMVHGLGFSGAMAEAQVPQGALPWALAGFNIGVEIGQLFIIALWSLVYLSIHRWAGYSRYVVQGGSAVLILVAMYWFAERVGWLS